MSHTADHAARHDPVTHHCVTGHEIPDDRLLDETETVSLDAGAEVRICRAHGAPIAITVGAPAAAHARAAAYLEGDDGP